ncbi:hypothetical protein BDV95DRAFT_526442 [Massariosphaeria phaeospora]|uniref:Zn(2)-C6 fungal-type domain-containing protein n=1 Tax=Massariosphaeria phaeospora TaxID=100035 RepID=A0A7C8M5T7_9PLEO|nr:hypothetical protein BDV95DRAFT_526442 [Massariosphaeria phaeospora]
MLKPGAAVKRSACDQCKAKRVRCLRAQDSMASCARCCHIGARCVTGAAGQPGRPPKQRLAVSSPRSHPTPTLRDMHHVEGDAPAMAVVHASARALKSAVHLHPHSPRDPVAPEPQPDFWIAPGDMSDFFDSPFLCMDQSPGPGHNVLSLAHPLSSPTQLQALLSADDELNAMLHMGGDSSTALDMDFGPALDHGEGLLPLTPLSQCFSAASSLVRFREEIDQRIATVDAYYSEPDKVLQQCKDGGGGRDVENPAALLLTCSKEFTDIVQSLTPAAQLHAQTEDALSTEIVLLALSGYLALMRLFDYIFHRMYKYVCQMAPVSCGSIKVKSVLRIGGVSLLQDMPLKVYALGILDAIKGQMQTLERCMGIPAEYCLSGEAAAAPTAAVLGIFSRAHRAPLFWAVMAQEDVKSLHSRKS